MNEPPGATGSVRQAELCAAVDDAFEREQVPLLRRLVEMPSHTGAKADVEAAAAVLDEAAHAAGLRMRRVPDPQGVYADHRVYTTSACGDGDRSLALIGHIDTVFPRSLGFLAFARDDGPDGPGTGDLVRGPGVLDMKSGLTAMLGAIAAVRRVYGDDAQALCLRMIINSDEEVGSPSSEPLLRELAPHLTAALVFEAGRDADRIVTSRKGGGMFEFTVHGRAAHAGNDHAAGVNAIHALALLVPRFEGLTDYARGVTVNVGVIEGGSSKNTVPERARCLLDTRFDTLADAQRVIAQLQAWAAQPFGPDDDVPDKLRTVRASLGGAMTRPPMEPSPASQALRLRYETCAAAVGLGVGEAPRQGGGSDGNLLAAFGVPSIDGLGPWGKNFHQTSEYSSLTSLRRRTQALALVLAQELERT
ncbi:MAG: M20/M25/M40 family metallo-hydrolase [Deltaproteobacteria bacterium]|nr:M20/M25/M40 family metallo-hydrolase [Deltaproteobacteria bacterium]MBP7290593.1 M20/M25/M40 family metallo-hydrolase [Nannocystaceae bacterium]